MADSWTGKITDSFLSSITAGLQAMAGVKPEVAVVANPSAPPVTLSWKQYEATPFSTNLMWCAIDDEYQIRVGGLIGEAVGLPDPDAETALSFWAESWAQIIGSVASALSTSCGTEVKLTETSSNIPVDLSGSAIEFSVGLPGGVDGSVWIIIKGAAVSAPVAAPVDERLESVGMRMLANVELPVTVSFGKAYLTVKDIVKLNTGSIIELNRSISEPVDVKVNNAIIARGEVVVVDGNYGIRVLEVRKATLDGGRARAGG